MQAEAEEMLQGLASLRARQSEAHSQQIEQQLALAALQVSLHPSMTCMLTSLSCPMNALCSWLHIAMPGAQ